MVTHPDVRRIGLRGAVPIMGQTMIQVLQQQLVLQQQRQGHQRSQLRTQPSEKQVERERLRAR